MKKYNHMDLINQITLADCMDIMLFLPNKYIDLAVVDPPYGIGENWKKNKHGQHYKKDNDYKNESIPDQKYFNELFRVSKNQIIWGGNYFTKYLEPTNNLIIWDKVRNVEKTFMSEGEIAWTSFNIPLRFYRHQWDGGKKQNETGIKTIHPHQKPVALYRWCLQKYAKPGQLIFDSHSGSGSLACACHLEGFSFIATEKNKNYYNESLKRFNDLRSQGVFNFAI